MKDFWFVLISAFVLLFISTQWQHVKSKSGWTFAVIAWGVIFFEHLSKLH